jgi:SAM-dependent methyltransferase
MTTATMVRERLEATSGSRHGTSALLRLRAALRPPGAEARRVVGELFGQAVPVDAAMLEGLIGRAAVSELVGLAVARRADGQIVPEVHFDRVGDLFIASDVARRREQSDFVMGLGPSSFLLARSVRRPVAGPILDLGSGSGIQGLLLGSIEEQVVSLDINPRALAFNRFNAALNGRPGIRFQLGSFLDDRPDRRLDGRFATVVANPPFVLAPTWERTYRDRPLPGDLVGQRSVERVGRALRRGGRGYVVCNWIDRGAEWSSPVREWLIGSGLDAVVTRVITRTTPEYAMQWTRDLPEACRPAASARWAAALDAEGVSRVHTGVIAVARPANGAPTHARFRAVDSLGVAVPWQTIEELLAQAG